MLSEAEQDYLKAIYKLLHEKPNVHNVTTNLLAEHLQVAAPSATNMIKNLASLKLVKYERYKGVSLTREGEKIALEMVRHHRLVELYLAKALGVPWDQVDKEAEKWEHVISEDIEDRMDEFLGNPTHDPHGAPIPTKEGEIEKMEATPLSEAEAGHKGTIAEVSDHDPAMLRYLSDLGLLPNKKITVLTKEPFNGPIQVKLGRHKKTVGHEVAQYVYITTVD